MKLPLASKHILSTVNDYNYLCCFCNGFSTTIKYVINNDLDDFYEDKCEYCEYLEDESCDGGSSILEEGGCYEYNIKDFKQHHYIYVNVPNHVYIEKYEYESYRTSFLLVLHDGVFKPLMFPNVRDYGEICFAKAYARTPALRYSNYWNSEFNDDLTDDCLRNDIDALEEYLSNWSIEKQNDIYNVDVYNLSDFIDEDHYIESDTATDVIFAEDKVTDKYYIGLGTNTSNNLNINYL